LDDVGLLDLVIVSWPCQGHFQASMMMVFLTMSKIFWGVAMNVVTSITHFLKPFIYLLENVPPLGVRWHGIIINVHEIPLI